VRQVRAPWVPTKWCEGAGRAVAVEDIEDDGRAKCSACHRFVRPRKRTTYPVNCSPTHGGPRDSYRIPAHRRVVK
jgi:hypothetical protein